MIAAHRMYDAADMEVEKLPKSRPYELVIRKLQTQLAQTRDDDDRFRIEKDIIYFLALRQATSCLDRIASSLEKLTNGDT